MTGNGLMRRRIAGGLLAAVGAAGLMAGAGRAAPPTLTGEVATPTGEKGSGATVRYVASPPANDYQPVALASVRTDAPARRSL